MSNPQGYEEPDQEAASRTQENGGEPGHSKGMVSKTNSCSDGEFRGISFTHAILVLLLRWVIVCFSPSDISCM